MINNVTANPAEKTLAEESHVYSFQPKARTVDHLGREQIADTPTAVTELWKNAYDAYARSVSLHIFGGGFPIAAILDDGSGMSSDEFIGRWLVLGTEAKVEDEGDDVQAIQDRDGLPMRVRQGQKGIGRLSVAFLGPVALVITKRKGHGFVTSLVDWRLFENPHLLLADIGIPVRGFTDPSEFPAVFKLLVDDSMDNVWGRNGNEDRNARIGAAWLKLTEAENRAGVETSTADRIATSMLDAEIGSSVLEHWTVWNGERQHGTALFILDIRDELRAWVDVDRLHNDDEAAQLRASMKTTLAGFADPFAEHPLGFEYSMVVHRGEIRDVVVSSHEQFGLHDLRQMEHYVEGRFDEQGVFYGKVRAFMKNFGDFSIVPTRPVRTSRLTRVGPFDFCLGTFEQNVANSTHPPEIHQALGAQLETLAGLRIYRDGLRVLPYGRPEFDFFGIEERRSKHAGREYWQHRRMFGRIAISKSANPNLRDKAGREGLIDNAARRELRDLVVELLQYTARQYFGTAAEHRDSFLDEINTFNKAAAEAETKASRTRMRALTAHLKINSEPLDRALGEIKLIQNDLKQARQSSDIDKVLLLAARIEKVQEMRSSLKPPPRPAKLNRVEADYRSFRDRYNMLLSAVESTSSDWTQAAEALGSKQPLEIAKSAFGRHQKFLTDDINRRLQEIRLLFTSESERLEKNGQEDRSRFYKIAFPLLQDLEAGNSDLQAVLSSFEQIREQHHQETARVYSGYANALKKLAEGIDLDAAVTWSSDQRAELEARVSQLSALAQLGITVEIVGHELESLDAEVGRNLRRLPSDIRELDAYRLALSAQEALVNRLRFLTPLRLSGPQLKDTITGDNIAKYLERFFADALRNEGITFDATSSFRSLRIVDFSHRIFPVFINLINNATYWLKQSADKRIKLDLYGEDAVVADSGPGVDPDDQKHLFELFFSRRVEGRGVGLYLSRANLAASGHTIRYQNGGPILDGANFLIRFKDMANG
jgi:signal transduction histidine kinase